MLEAPALHKGLKTKRFGRKIYTFETLDSTSNCARAIAACGAAEGSVVIAEEQTEGRGRRGRQWHSDPGRNLMFSLILRPDVPPEKMNLIPLYAAVALAEAIQKETDLKVDCKWPNDLLIRGKKIGGILLEGALTRNTIEYLIMGIGLNVNQEEFPPELSPIATSLKIEAGKELDRVGLFHTLLRTLEERYHSLSALVPESLVSAWLSRSPMLNKPVSVLQDGRQMTGIMTGLSKEGGMILSVDGTDHILHAGEATILTGPSDASRH